MFGTAAESDMCVCVRLCVRRWSQRGRTPIDHAAANNRVEILTLLLDKLANACANEPHAKRELLRHAVTSALSGGRTCSEALALVVDHGAVLELQDKEALDSMDLEQKNKVCEYCVRKCGIGCGAATPQCVSLCVACAGWPNAALEGGSVRSSGGGGGIASCWCTCGCCR